MEPPIAPESGFDPPENEDELWNREFLAGYLDGRRIARVEALNVLRVELARFYLEVDDDLSVVATEQRPCFDIERPPEKDNPENHPGYEVGFEKGHGEAFQAITDELRAEVIDAGVFVSDSGHVVTTDAASKLVDVFRDVLSKRDVEQDLTDDALHAFLDEVMLAPQGRREPLRSRKQSSSRQHPVPESLSEAQATDHGSPPTPLHKALPEKASVIADVHRPRSNHATHAFTSRTNRRTAIAVLATAVLSTTATLLLRGADEPAKPPATQPSTYVPPTTWSGMPSVIEQSLLAWDQTMWLAEAAGQHHVARELVAGIMGGESDDGIKQRIAFFVGTSGRGYLSSAIALGLHPQRSDNFTRTTITAELERLYATVGAAAFPPSLQQALVQYRDAHIDPSPQVTRTLERLLSHLGL